MEFNEEHIEALLKDLTPSPPSPSPWQAEVITIEGDAAPADPITIDDGTESDCDPLQKEDIEKMKVEEDDSDSEDEGSLGQASPSTRAGVRLAASTSVRSVNSFLVLPRAVPNAKGQFVHGAATRRARRLRVRHGAWQHQDRIDRPHRR
ncbi:hypothetical protein E4U46_006982 [Claviceps purpurea]|nr:hypothetical protein E4U51_006983 [Claviceps purpurea]KAG6179797.1 hypothetical protein E4U27_003054 [Claviceps purpurea]KAG6284520.1 hypothetical protein E4U46_006982 [Claviceps purpurea]